jgi:hypothetical protein
MLALTLGPSSGLAQQREGRHGSARQWLSRPSSLISTRLLTRAPRVRPAQAVSGPTLRRVPEVYPSIQEAIDASYDGDTVLVSEGTYYENIRLRGKAVAVGSLCLIDGDSGHVERTVIDGSRPAKADSASVVYIIDGEDTTSVLFGLTITGGRGTVVDVGWGIGRGGGGVFIERSSARVVRNLITRNSARGAAGFGGGLCAGSLFTVTATPIILEGNRISDNIAWGDSLWGASGAAEFVNCNFRVIGNTFERDTAGGGQYTQGGAIGVYGVPVEGGWFPEGEITGNVFRANVCLETLNTYPSNAVGGALVLNRSGAVTISDNLFEANSISSQYGWADGGGVLIDDHDTTGYGRKLVLRNRFLRNRAYTATFQAVTASGGGVGLYRTLATVRENLFTENSAVGRTASNSGAVSIWNSSFVFDGNVVVQNSATTFANDNGIGGGMMFGSPPQEGTDQVIVNNLFVGNFCDLAGGAIATWDWPWTGVPSAIMNNTMIGNRAGNEGGGIVIWENPQFLLLMNNILRDNIARYAPNQISNYSAVGRILHNDIQGGWPGEGNFDADPRFVGALYALSDSSLCIGAGKDSALIAGSWFFAPNADMAGNIRPDPPGSMPDVGAMEHWRPLPLGASPLRLISDALRFENVMPGTCSNTLFVTLINRGADEREILALSWSRTEFALVPPPTLPVSVPPFDTVRLGLVFRPLVSGLALSDTLRITTSDTLFGQAMVSLSGRGSGPVQSAQPGVLYAVSSSASEVRLYRLERSSGAAQLVARYCPRLPSRVKAIALRGQDYALYGALSDGASTRLYRLSTEMGDSEPDRLIPVTDVASMTFGPAGDLYVLTEGGVLYRLTGAEEPVRVGFTGHPLTGLAFHPCTYVLWGTSRDSVLTLDPTTGEASLVGASGWSAPHSSIAFAPTGAMYALYGDNLVTLGNVWGEPTVVGVTGVPDLVGIAMRSDAASLEVERVPEVPREVCLMQNYPNPFNPTTVIPFELPSARDVRLAVFDLLGREVALLLDERKPVGVHSVAFNASRLPSGVYFCRLNAGSVVRTRRMIVVK